MGKKKDPIPLSALDEYREKISAAFFSNLFFLKVNKGAYLRPPRSFTEKLLYLLMLCMAIELLTRLPTVEATGTKDNKHKKKSDLTAVNTADKSNSVHTQAQLSFYRENQSSHVTPVNTQTKKKQRKFCQSLFSQNKVLRENNKKAKYLRNLVKRKMPLKLNRPANTEIYVDNEGVSLVSMDNMPDLVHEQRRIKLLSDHKQLLSQEFCEYSVQPLSEGISARALQDPILLYSDDEIERVNQEYIAINNYVTRVGMLQCDAEMHEQLGGGTCGNQSALMVIEALKKGYALEMVEMYNHKDHTQSHVFTVIGRDPNSSLEDLSSWGDNAIIIDYWAYDDAIPVSLILNNKKQYGLYFVKNWLWSVTLFSPRLPESLKGPSYHKYQQLRDYFDFCQKKLTNIITESVEINRASLAFTK